MPPGKLGPGILKTLWTFYVFSVHGNTEARNRPQIFTGSTGQGGEVPRYADSKQELRQALNIAIT